MFESRQVFESYTGGSYHIVGHTSRFTAMTYSRKFQAMFIEFTVFAVLDLFSKTLSSNLWPMARPIWGSYLEVENLSPKGSIDRDVSRG